MAEKDTPIALVTGAAHRLGRAFALCLARRGYAILLHYFRSVRQANATADEIRGLGVPVFLAQADLTDLDQIRSLFTALDALPHPLQILINSAASMQRHSALSLSVDDWDATMDLNLRAPFLLSQQAEKRMGADGLIVNVTDVGAAKPWTGFPDYAVSKAGLEALTRVLAKSYAPKVRVNAIAPGLILPSENVTREEWKKLVGRLPMKRPASLDDLTSALEFLINNHSVTGQTIAVDGGYSLV